MSDWDGIAEHWGRGHYRDVPVSKWVQLARDRQVRDLTNQNSPNFPYYYDDKAADRAVWFFSELRHFKGKKWVGRPFKLEGWQEWDLIRPLYGWKRQSDGTRRFRRVLLKVGRKNGKTQIGSGCGLYAMRADNEPAAECYCGATKEEQAKIAWRAARLMAKRSPLLEEEVQSSTKSLFHADSESFFKPLGRDSKTDDGLDVHFGLVDEYHAHRTDEMLGVLETGTGARDQPIIMITSTEGLSTGPLKDEENLAKKILEQSCDNEQYLAYICEVDDPEKWEEESEWYKANPMLDISLNLEDFRNECELARQSTTRRIHFKVKRLNISCDSRHSWITSDLFKLCDGEVDWSKFEGKRCFAAVDLGKNGDLSVISLAFMDEMDARKKKANLSVSEDDLPRIYTKRFYWCPEEGIVRKWQEDGICYPLWAEQGWISKSPGPTNRNDLIRNKFNELRKIYDIAEIAADQWNSGDLLLDLENDDFTVIKHPQSISGMTLPCKIYEKLVRQGRLRHGNDPVLKWMVPNAVAVTDGNENIKLMKNRSRERIDGLIADIMAVGRLMIAPEPQIFEYNSRGIFVA